MNPSTIESATDLTERHETELEVKRADVCRRRAEAIAAHKEALQDEVDRVHAAEKAKQAEQATTAPYPPWQDTPVSFRGEYRTCMWLIGVGALIVAIMVGILAIFARDEFLGLLACGSLAVAGAMWLWRKFYK